MYPETKDTVVNKAGKVPAPMKITFYDVRQTIKRKQIIKMTS